MAVASDERNTALEIYPYGVVLSSEDPRTIVPDPSPASSTLTATHLAIGTKLTADEVFAICAREGWTANRIRRAMGFDVIELWLENRVMLEVLTDEMQAEYLEACTTQRWLSAHEKWTAAKAAGAM